MPEPTERANRFTFRDPDIRAKRKLRGHSLGGVLMLARSCLLLLLLPALSLSQDSAGIFFEQKVRPLLANHCYRCHGPEKQQGKLRLDSLDAMKKGGELGPV